MRWVHCLVVFCALSISSGPCWGQRLTPEKLWDLARIGDAAVSPDGKLLAYLVTRYDLKSNKGTTSLMLQSLPESEIRTNEKKAAAFDTPLVAPTAKTRLKDVNGLSSLGWLNHSSGSKLIYIAPAKDTKENDDKVAESEDDKKGNGKDEDEEEEDEEEEEEGKPQAWMLDPSDGDPLQLTHVEEGVGKPEGISLG